MSGELIQLSAGQQVQRWKIEKKLGEGGFGAVYRVFDSSGKYAMKVEGANEEIQVLKLEVSVLTELSKRGNRHFCRIEDKGRFKNFNYVVMTLVGKSLEDLRKAGNGGHMSMGCSIGIGIQALEALEDLHGIGYLHRDVKPGNYTIGRPELNEIRKVYILDFGMCRKFTGTDGNHQKATSSLQGFRGNCQNMLQSVVTCKKTCVEVMTWKLGCICKRNCLTDDFHGLISTIWAQVGKQKQAIRKMSISCSLHLKMRQSFSSTGSSEQAPYDWEAGGPASHVLR
ncbi:hypothetical protein CRE_26871 [Caenorhabditis remanei]|uniref:non-specific serine/threonine protein kinase n=1 Tax=Caenorhabditis remanei TaxID=31234 RepID=E3NPR7_CAERE|nr:hypothetical protein CRE_26871 [Caenorhabditis remanei]